MRQIITTYYLEQTDPAQLCPARPAPALMLMRAEEPSPELGRFLYTAVGGNWYWTDRLSWDYARWLARLSRPGIETWVGYVAGTPVGYFELDHEGESVEIAYFGLVPRFIGRGLGGALLTAAIQRGWALGVSRVWVHTCSLDGPTALANYQARGMRQYKLEQHEAELADAPPGPW
ncbi:MAG: GNAT family N-acetyltransferase [Oscillochloridaceae bacterium umkhey_bin13]